MKTIEFLARIGADAALEVPPEVAAQLPQGQAVRVIVLMSEANENQDWSRLTAERFPAGYDESDAVYDRSHS